MKSNNFLKPMKRAELMKGYSLEDLNKEGTLNLCVGEIVALKGLAIRLNFDDLADKLRKAEKKILKSK